MTKKFLICLLIAFSVFFSAYRHPEKFDIKAERNAYYHNNVALNYLKERVYYAAIQEFKIAISLSPSTQATAIFKDNLGKTYMFIGYPDMARICFEDAIQLYGLNFQYYLDLMDCYQQLNIVQTKINEYRASNNVYDKIKLGILYIKTGHLRQGVNILDDFCMSEPDLIITPAVKQYIKQVLKTEQQN